MGFSRQEYWSGLPFPSPAYFSNPGIKPMSSERQEESLPLRHMGRPIYVCTCVCVCVCVYIYIYTYIHKMFLWPLHKSLWTVTTAMELKDACSLEEKL